jgi:peptide/nickel transport system substrate-binding protein
LGYALTKDKKLDVKSLTNNDAAVNNKEGKYQVVKITTDQSMPKEVNYLTHSSAGILSKSHVTAMNNNNNDKPYGDPSTIPTKDSGKNSLYASGPYIMTKKTNYQASFERNPGFNEREQRQLWSCPYKKYCFKI